MTAQPSPPVDEPATPERVAAPPARVLTAAPVEGGPAAPARPRSRFGAPPRGPLLTGLVASLLLMIGGFGGGGVLVRDPILTNSAVGFWRYGHGRELATALIYLGVVLMAWAWIRLGREVLAQRVGGRAVLTTAGVWLIPMLVTPPLFTRDVFSYLAQGALPLAGFDPYAVGPEAMPSVFTSNVHYFWQDTPAPYGPLFILLAKTVAWAAGTNIIAGVLLMRLTLVLGLLLLVWALPELTRRLGGRVPVALWVAVANPMMIIHMVGGGHNDLLVMGLLAAGALVALRGRHVVGIVLVTAAMGVKASAGVALPFLVLVWAAHLNGSQTARITKAAAAGIGVFASVFALITLAARVDLGWLPALSAPSMIVNWMSLPTGVGEFVHWLLEIPFDLPKQPFINVARIIGGIALLVIAVRQWWAARNGGPEAIRRAGIVLLAVAVLSPAMLPWYVSWGMALIAGAPWSRRALSWLVFFSLMLVIVYYPNGEDALYNWFYLAVCAALSALGAVSLHRVDPLHLRLRTPAASPSVPDELADAGQRSG
ncbi:MAG: polyprenol phosphomannose-dependent alpha 1,6 mannosyltransferase MptB [Pseudonocardia sp.]